MNLRGFFLRKYLAESKTCRIFALEMTNKRDKTKKQQAQLNRQLEPVEKSPKMVNTWVENLGKYLLDVSKFTITGVVIASLFKDMEDKSIIYIVGTTVAISTLIVGLVLSNKKKKRED